MVVLYVLAGALFGVVSYWCARKVRTFVAWAEGNEPPKEKAIVFMIMSALCFAVVGYLLYDVVQMMSGCEGTHVECFINGAMNGR